MYHSAVLPPSHTGMSIGGSSEDELEQTFLQRTGTTKSLILSPLTLERAFSPTTLALLQTRGGDGTVSPLPRHHPTQSLGSTADFTSFLPAEIIVSILFYLDPQDLCSAYAVCNRWCQLTQLWRVLDRRRKAYVESRREEYLESKENYMYMPAEAPVLRTLIMTKAPSPLGNIQLPISPSSQHPPSPSTWDSPLSSPTLTTLPMLSIQTPPSYHPTSPPWNTPNHTSSPTTLLVDDVKFLSLDDHQDIALYRTLPPDLKWVESTLRHIAGRKKLNKNRLRRL